MVAVGAEAKLPVAVAGVGLLVFPPVVVPEVLVDMVSSSGSSGSTGLDQSAIEPCSEMSTRECGEPAWGPLVGRDGVSEILQERALGER